jgi:signal transduction histidine kinase
VEAITREAKRAVGVVKNLLTFARKHTPVRQLAQINNIIEDVLQLRAYEHKVNNVQIDTRFASELPEIMVDYFQMQQVFLNIILNAEYAMIEAHKQGALTITTERFNSNIKVTFTDDGPGINQKDLARLFDPFFTTKVVGKGTGLGLSICYGIVTGHSGKIYAQSEMGSGATFVVELPISSY